MKNQIVKVDNEAVAQRFVEGLSQVNATIMELAEMVVQAMDDDPLFVERVQKKKPEITEALIMRFYEVGQKQIHEALMFDDCVGGRRLRQLSYHEQEKYVAKPLALLVKGEDGWDELPVDYRNITGHQAQQLFKKGGVRTPAEQRAWLESRKPKIAVRIDKPYRVVKDKFVALEAPFEMTRRQLLEALAEMG